MQIMRFECYLMFAENDEFDSCLVTSSAVGSNQDVLVAALVAMYCTVAITGSTVRYEP